MVTSSAGMASRSQARFRQGWHSENGEGAPLARAAVAEQTPDLDDHKMLQLGKALLSPSIRAKLRPSLALIKADLDRQIMELQEQRDIVDTAMGGTAETAIEQPIQTKIEPEPKVINARPSSIGYDIAPQSLLQRQKKVPNKKFGRVAFILYMLRNGQDGKGMTVRELDQRLDELGFDPHGPNSAAACRSTIRDHSGKGQRLFYFTGMNARGGELIKGDMNNIKKYLSSATMIER